MRTFVVLLALHGVFASVEETDKDCGADETCLVQEDCPTFLEKYERYKKLTRGSEKSNLETSLKEAVCNKREKAVCCPKCGVFDECIARNECKYADERLEQRKVFQIQGKSEKAKEILQELKSRICDEKRRFLCCPRQSDVSADTTPPGNVVEGEDTVPGETGNICKSEGQIYPEYFLPKKDQCGVSCSGTKSVVFGSNAVLGEFPWAALVGYRITLEDFDNKIKQIVNKTYTHYHCGGTLINTWFVLTAAHCQKRDTRIVEVVLGEWDVLTNPDCATNDQNCDNPRVQKQAVADVIVHSSFDKSRFTNDIAIVKMKTEVKLNRFVQFACLPLTEYNFHFSNNATVIGWGQSSNTNQPINNQLIKMQHGVLEPKLQKGELTIQPALLCKEAYPRYPITISHLCADGGRKNTDSCSGDSGGGLFVNSEDYPGQSEGNVHVLVGVVSYGGRPCGDSPSVYTKVDQFIPWIKKTIG